MPPDTRHRKLGAAGLAIVITLVAVVAIAGTGVAPAVFGGEDADDDFPPATDDVEDPVVDYDRIDVRLNLTSNASDELDYRVVVLGAIEPANDHAEDTVTCDEQVCVVDGTLDEDDEAVYNLSGAVLNATPEEDLVASVNGTFEGQALEGLGLGAVFPVDDTSGEDATTESNATLVDRAADAEDHADRTDATVDIETSASAEGDDSDTAAEDDQDGDEDRTSWTVTVDEVVDGDTIDVRYPNGSEETIRLLGVDAPESSADDVDPSDWEGIPDSDDGREWLDERGDDATEFARDRYSPGDEIYIEIDEQADSRGSYGRLLVYVYDDEDVETSFNLDLVDAGHARTYDTEFSRKDTFLDAESDAQDDETGVWGYEDSGSADGGDEDEDGDADSDGDVVVHEVHADAAGNDHENLNDEYFVLRNDGDSAVDMDGWTVSDEADHTYEISDFTLEAGETVTIYTGSGSDADSELYWGSDSAIWNNDGDTIYVTDDSGETVISHEY